ncbi:sarcosine oxidase subunit gamma [Paracoccus sp. KR1-242]|uniref:sarcosine oxidase subunit gamma n=1 Tax=Paracoccus sp. KR1-242 TaxID=3410028 RepID=UPI003BFBAD47
MADALADINEITGLGMIQIRADQKRLGKALAKAAGLPLPASGTASAKGTRRLCWMSPDELLLVLPAAETTQAVAALTGAVADEHALILDVSDMRVAFAISGSRAEQVLMKLCPTEIAAMPENGMRRTRAAQVACGIWREGEGFALVGFRSVADYLHGILAGAARSGTALDPR